LEPSKRQVKWAAVSNNDGRNDRAIGQLVAMHIVFPLSAGGKRLVNGAIEWTYYLLLSYPLLGV